MLLESVASTAVLTRVGRAPIHYACMSFRGLSVEAFAVLLEATMEHGFFTYSSDLEDLMEDDSYPEQDDYTSKTNVMTMRDSTGQTPMGLLFRRYKERVRCVIQTVEKLRKEQPSTSSLQAAMKVHADLGELWEKARLIVTRLTEQNFLHRPICNHGQDSPAEQAVAEAAAEWAAEQHRKLLSGHEPRLSFRIVHASVGLTGYGCPPEMIRLALSIHPEQIQEMDEDGNLPIHVAATASSVVVSAGGNDEDSMVSDLSFLSTATACTNVFDKVLRILLHQYPAAARIPHGVSGKLPLILALETRSWDDGIKTLLDAFPAALHAKRMLPGVYPYVLAKVGRPSLFLDMVRVGGGRPRDRGVASLFELLKAKPDLVKRCNYYAVEEESPTLMNYLEPVRPVDLLETMHM